MNFGEALKELNNGNLVSRLNWNGKGMFIYKTIGNTVSKEFLPKFVSLPQSVKNKLIELNIDVIFNSQLTMFTAKKEMQPGWLASQADILAEDWELVN